MSFGFGVGDFLVVGGLVWDVYRAYADAPEQFRNFSQEILALHVIVRKIEGQLGISGSDGTASGSQLPAVGSRSQPPTIATLSTKDKNDLKILYDGLHAIMKELDDLIKKYQSLESTRNPVERFKWGQEDLVGLRDKIRSNITMLTAFNATLANCQLAHQSAQLVQQNIHLAQQNAQFIRLQEQLEQLLPTGGLRRRVSVATMHSITSFALSIGQKEAWKEAWKELSRELHRNGITADTIRAKKEEICKLLRTSSVISLSGKSDTKGVLQGPETEQEGEPGKRSDLALFDSMAEVLALPAMRAKSLVTRLVRSRTELPLYDAAASGLTGLVEVLLDKGANIDASDNNKWTALHWAAHNGHIEVVKVLLGRGATIDATDNENRTALHWAADGAHIDIVKVLLDRGATIDVTDNGNQAALSSRATVLHFAARWDHIDIVKALLERGVTIDATNSENWTALHWAAYEGHIDTVRVLLDGGATIDAADNGNRTALHRAASKGGIEVVKMLLDRGASIDATTSSKATVLHWAADGGHTDIVKVLLDRGATINAIDNENRTALHWAAYGGHIDIVRVLLDEGASIDATSSSQWTALHFAARWDHIDVVKALLDRGASIDATTDRGRTALLEVCAAEWPYVMWQRGIEAVQVLLESGTSTSIVVADKMGYTALHYAVAGCGERSKIVQLLLDNGANINRKNADGETAVDIARRLHWELTSTTYTHMV